MLAAAADGDDVTPVAMVPVAMVLAAASEGRQSWTRLGPVTMMMMMMMLISYK